MKPPRELVGVKLGWRWRTYAQNVLKQQPLERASLSCRGLRFILRLKSLMGQFFVRILPSSSIGPWLGKISVQVESFGFRLDKNLSLIQKPFKYDILFNIRKIERLNLKVTIFINIRSIILVSCKYSLIILLVLKYYYKY